MAKPTGIVPSLSGSPVFFGVCLGLILSPGLARAQHGEHGEPNRGGGQHVGAPPARFPAGPPRGPAPAPPRPPIRPQPESHAPPPAAERRPEPPRAEHAGGDDRPHVDRNARWVGHDTGRHDVRYQVDHPWAHGRFSHPMGRGHVYRIGGWDAPRRRFWFASSFFVVAEPDWGYANDWDWADDQVVLYDDPDHPGFYLAYNVRLGTYVHVQYDGPQ
jgi:hypothetical protein